MSQRAQISVFGEVLYDCFPDGKQILGGAPFNVAWHLQALGDRPRFISRVGSDTLGTTILRAMQDWGMVCDGVESDPHHPTGQVDVRFVDGEPHYDIVDNSAYDFITATSHSPLTPDDMLYHGTLCLRHEVSRQALDRIIATGHPKIFLDVNLRRPWWQRDEVFARLEQATWVKMNEEELTLLSKTDDDIQDAMSHLQQRFSLQHVLVTRGARGTMLLAEDGRFHTLRPPAVSHIVDTVGAGDAYSAVYLHGLAAGWPLDELLEAAQQFANKIIAMRGATADDITLYESLTNRSTILVNR